MTFREFRNGLCILRSIDQHELVEAGIIKTDDVRAWSAFRVHPYDWLLHADDAATNKLWQLMQERGA